MLHIQPMYNHKYFKPGDFITGTINNDYTTTSNDCLLVVTASYGKTFNGVVIDHKNIKQRKFIGEMYYNLEYSEFELCCDWDNSSTVKEVALQGLMSIEEEFNELVNKKNLYKKILTD